jgi:hypothetical protein
MAANAELQNPKLQTSLLFPAGSLEMVASNATSWNFLNCVGLHGDAM